MGPQHWRGDRQGDEISGFEAFNVAFPGLVGRDTELDPADMTRFREFALLLRYPPNPVRLIDNSLRAGELAGRNLYNGAVTDTISNCNGCHTLSAADGHFGGDGRTIFDGGTQHFKTPHLRNDYQKVGMFGMSEPEGQLLTFNGDFTHQGPQIRGFGYVHDGGVDTLGRFFGLGGFSMNSTQEAQMWDFTMAFDTDFAPVVGQQVTINADNHGDGWDDGEEVSLLTDPTNPASFPGMPVPIMPWAGHLMLMTAVFFSGRWAIMTRRK